MIKHLRVPVSNAQEAKSHIESLNAMNTDFLPIKEDGFILWPLKFDIIGDVVKRNGHPSSRKSRDYRRLLPEKIRNKAPRAYDVFGEIAIIKLPQDLFTYTEVISNSLLAVNSNISKVAVDMGVEGKYRVRRLKLIAGEPGFVSTHKENGLIFQLDISKVYFSPRLAMERNRISQMVSSSEQILDAFAGAAPFSVTLAHRGCIVTSIDSNPEAKIWGEKNFKLNNVKEDNYKFISSEIESAVNSLGTFDRIIMNHPTQSLKYLDYLLPLLREEGVIHLYTMADKSNILEKESFFKSKFKEVRHRIVHPYSSSISLVVFDMFRQVLMSKA